MGYHSRCFLPLRFGGTRAIAHFFSLQPLGKREQIEGCDAHYEDGSERGQPAEKHEGIGYKAHQKREEHSAKESGNHESCELVFEIGRASCRERV